MGGAILVETEPGAGTMFEVYLPEATGRRHEEIPHIR
jgi:signal transduction histidine kinase